MMEITAKYDSNGIYFISAQGHTGYAHRGADIVCAAVSSLIQALGVGLRDVLKLENAEIKRDAESALISYKWDSSLVEAQCLAKTILLSVKSVSESYHEFIEVIEIRDGTN
ncbi:MAG: ribosomal-processing cysteine protease Prp [Synergistaceae bacterium]|jgi:uncharacterized protein YsxB (DUF464 family)|nr:ribosomal-processing cysteine protease Prp [Synergistaceae bacterium]